MNQGTPAGRPPAVTPTPSGTMARNVALACASCSTGAVVPADALSFSCRGCGFNNFFCACSQCDSTCCVATRRDAPAARWECEWCSRPSSLPVFGRIPVRSARQLHGMLEAHGLGSADSDSATVVGFTVEASSAIDIKVGGPCDLQLRADHIELSQAGVHTALRFAYPRLERFEISGRGPDDSEPTGVDALWGTRAASGSRRRVDAVLRLEAGPDRVVIRHARHTREQLRRALAPAFARWDTARRPAGGEGLSFELAVQRLEKLTMLYTNGALSADEFLGLRVPFDARIAAPTRPRAGQPAG